jgi:membrane protein DedA with SNARE-associated domain
MSRAVSLLVARYGYAAVAVGALLEGETVLLAAGFAAHRGLLDLRLVMLIAGLAGTLGDQLYFALGRRYGASLLRRFPRLAGQAPRIKALLDRHHTALIPAIRFMVGLRTAGPLLIGWAGVNPWRFALLNMLGAAAWAVLVGGLGYVFGAMMERLLADIESVEGVLLAGIVVVGLALHAGRRLWRRNKPGQT